MIPFTYLVCSPQYYDVTYDINPWMTGQRGKVDHALATLQWNTLLNTLSRLAVVRIINGRPHLPDMVFTANAGTVIGRRAVVSKFKHRERQFESSLFAAWFSNFGLEVVSTDSYYEGEGDHLVDKYGRHWLGTGFRTDVDAANELRVLFNDINLTVLELVDASWYHLDTCFCPLPCGALMWYPPAFSDDSKNYIRSSFRKTIELDETSALEFAANAIVVESTVIMPKLTNYIVEYQLQLLGYTVIQLDLSEFLRAGGAAKCLALRVR